MNSSDIDLKLAPLLRDALDLPAGADVAGLNRENCPEWDSLRHVKIILDVQKAFGMRFAAVDVIRVSSYSELRSKLSQKA
jgi:acyl carrier protein